MRDNWIKFSGAVSKEFCEDAIKRWLSLEPVEAKTFNEDHKTRRSLVRWITREVDLINYFLGFVNSANAQAFNVDIQQEMDEMQFTEYDAKYKGKYDWHHDVAFDNPKNFDRKLSVVIQLSDPKEYVGGKFEFGEVETPILEQGDMLIFPSYLKHRVTPVTEGKRYTLVSWIRGPRWR